MTLVYSVQNHGRYGPRYTVHWPNCRHIRNSVHIYDEFDKIPGLWIKLKIGVVSACKTCKPDMTGIEAEAHAIHLAKAEVEEKPPAPFEGYRRSNEDRNRLGETIRALLDAFPEQRLGQIIFNASRCLDGDFFNITDEDFLEALSTYLETR